MGNMCFVVEAQVLHLIQMVLEVEVFVGQSVE
jgi:hypothetical protein